MTLEEQVTSLELSRRLRDLGFAKPSAFGWYQKEKTIELKPHYNHRHPELINFGWLFLANAYLSSEVGKILPECYLTQRRLSKKYECFQDFTGVSEGNPVKHKEYKANFVSVFADTEAESRGLMLAYLLEHKLIKL